MGVGRFICVSLPFILTAASIICLLIAGLTGVTNTKGLYIFRVDTTNLTLDVSTLSEIAGVDDKVSDEINNQIGKFNGDENNNNNNKRFATRADIPEDLADNEAVQDIAKENGIDNVDSILSNINSIDDLNNIDGADLHLAKVYDINLWGYCATWQDDVHNCTKPKFNWAEGELSGNETLMAEFENVDGINDTVIPRIMDGLEAFEKLTKWTEVVFILAMIGLGLELFVGLFTACSRAASCVTWLISAFATVTVVAAAVLLTVMATIAVGTIEATASEQGVKASFNRSYLAVTWLGVAFAIAASSFWLFTICCCKPENRPYSKKSRGGHGDTEKFIPTGSYQPLGDSHHNNYNYGLPQRGGARSDLAYEPYSHSR